VEAIGLDLKHLDAERWVILAPAFINGEAHQYADHPH
jgi:hypothetical protein